MKRTASRVVALTPTWNAEQFIERTLESLAGQTYPDFQVLISDDASSDSTAAICERFAGKDRRFRLIRQTSNLGWVANTNCLLRQVSADYLFFAFHDDLFRPTFVEQLVARLEANRRASVAFSDMETVDSDGRKRIVAYEDLDGLTSRFSRAQTLIRRGENWWLPIHGMFRATAAKEVGGLRRHLAGEFSADWPWLVRMALLGEMDRVPSPLLTKTLRRGSVTHAWSFAPHHWYSVAGSCSWGVLKSGISVQEKLALWRDLAVFCLERRREARKWSAAQSAG